MLIKASDKDKKEILSFLKKEPYYNLFIIGDIKQYGLNTDFMKVFVLKKESRIDSVVLIYHTTLLLYDPNCKLSFNDLNELIKEYKVKNINTAYSTYSRFKDDFANKNKYACHLQYFAILEKPYNGDTSLAVKAEENDIHKIVESRYKIDEFGDFVQGKSLEDEYKINLISFKNKVSEPFIIKKDNQVIAHSSFAIQTEDLAIIGGVYTLKEYRNHGYASQVVTASSNYALAKNKKPLLFFDNPKAGKIYHKIGYKDFGKVVTIIIL